MRPESHPVGDCGAGFCAVVLWEVGGGSKLLRGLLCSDKPKFRDVPLEKEKVLGWVEECVEKRVGFEALKVMVVPDPK